MNKARVHFLYRKRGFTLTEIAIVLGIIGLILGAVWAAAKNVYANTNMSKGEQIASVLVASVRSTYAQSAPTTGDLTGAFNTTFPSSVGNIQPTIYGSSQSFGGSTVAGFVMDFSGGSGGTCPSGAKCLFGNTASDVAICRGVSQIGAVVTGAMVSSNTTFTTGCTCSGSTSPYAVASTGFVLGSNSCTAQNTGYCTGIPTTVCTAGATSTPVAVFIPWQS